MNKCATKRLKVTKTTEGSADGEQHHIRLREQVLEVCGLRYKYMSVGQSYWPSVTQYV